MKEVCLILLEKKGGFHVSLSMTLYRAPACAIEGMFLAHKSFTFNLRDHHI